MAQDYRALRWVPVQGAWLQSDTCVQADLSCTPAACACRANQLLVQGPELQAKHKRASWHLPVAALQQPSRCGADAGC